MRWKMSLLVIYRSKPDLYFVSPRLSRVFRLTDMLAMYRIKRFGRKWTVYSGWAMRCALISFFSRKKVFNLLETLPRLLIIWWVFAVWPFYLLAGGLMRRNLWWFDVCWRLYLLSVYHPWNYVEYIFGLTLHLPLCGWAYPLTYLEMHKENKNSVCYD